jgi:hypothetical protein
MPLTAKRVLKTFRYAMYFNGVNNYVKVANSPSLQPSSQITMCAWVSATYRGKKMPYIVYKFDPASPWPGYAVMLDQDGDTGHVGVWVGGALYVNGVSDVRDSIFHFICGGTDGSITYVYVDNMVECSYPQTPRLTSTIDLYIGSARGVAQFFQGYIAQVLIYSRFLSNSEIALNYSYPDTPVRNGLVLWLKADPAYVKDIDGDEILEWVDLSGYGNHGKIYGATLVKLIRDPVR